VEIPGPTGPPAFVDLDRPPLRQASLSAQLLRSPPWRELHVLQQVGSTNDAVAEAARAGDAEGLVVVAEEQTGGRGRLGRVWESPPRAGLTLSMLLRPGVRVSRRGWLPLLVATSLATTLAEHAGLDGVALKWPNDVLVGGRKIAGLLAEVVGDAVVVGVGLNVSTKREELPREDATSLQLAGARRADRAPLLLAFLREVGPAYLGWSGGTEDVAVREAYRRCCSTLGRQVQVELPGGGHLDGTALDVDAHGALVVDVAGTTRSVTAGDVVHVRPS
jgi:BirA family biotin operon repressor/biotin-[acetyl-CoA-carboxylase] ligase